MRSVVEIGASVPAFLGKLWKLVNDSETNHMISWSPGGKTFIIKNQAEFSRELLPLYYKHNNMASFIRQLNMYGFHKITSVENGGLRYQQDEIEFTHPCFMRGHAYLLEHIKRKIANPKAIVSSDSGEKIMLKPEVMNKVLADVKQMKGKQESMDAKFSVMKQENEALWREVAILRQKHIKQQQIVNNLIQFLMSLVQPSRSGNVNTNGVGVKRPYQLMINNAAHNIGESSFSAAKQAKKANTSVNHEEAVEENMEDGPTIHELAHDDVLQENTIDPLNPNDYLTIEVPSMEANVEAPQSVPLQYHVTMEDGDDVELTENPNYPIIRKVTTPTAAVSPLNITPMPATPSPISPALQSPVDRPLTDPNLVNGIMINPTSINIKKANAAANSPASQLMSPSHFNPILSNDLKLPADIFASDDSISDAGTLEGHIIGQVMSPSALLNPDAHQTRDRLVNGGEGLNFNIKVEPTSRTKPYVKKPKTKTQSSVPSTAQIKTELQDDGDWILATLNNNGDFDRIPSVNKRDLFKQNLEDRLISQQFGPRIDKSDLDDHLDTMQSDLDSLREMLRNDSYQLDTNTLMGLFGQDDPLYGLSMNSADDRQKGNNIADATNQLISYTGGLPDFADFSLNELEGENSQEASSLPDTLLEDASALNTPQVQIKSPTFTRP